MRTNMVGHLQKFLYDGAQLLQKQSTVLYMLTLFTCCVRGFNRVVTPVSNARGSPSSMSPFMSAIITNAIIWQNAKTISRAPPALASFCASSASAKNAAINTTIAIEHTTTAMI